MEIMENTAISEFPKPSSPSLFFSIMNRKSMGKFSPITKIMIARPLKQSNVMIVDKDML